MLSYTDMARSQAPAFPQKGLSDPIVAGRWFESLPPIVQQRLADQLTSIVRGMPVPLQIQLQASLISQGVRSPVPMLDGLGLVDAAVTAGSAAMDWGAIIGSLASAGMQVGAGLYTSHQNQSHQQDMQNNALAHNQQMQSAALAAQVKANQALLAAQTQAAQIAAAAKVQTASINAPVLAASMKWIALAVGAVALAGGGYFVLRRKK